ncbi:acyl-CoA dehydrogenase family protein [Nocardia heshunensis]
MTDWFTELGADALLKSEIQRQYPVNFLDFLGQSRLLVDSLVPTQLSNNPSGWHPYSIAALSEHLAFCSFTHWLMWHVTNLSVLPVWMSDNEHVRRAYVDELSQGIVGSFGMSERTAGADWRATAMRVLEDSTGYVASGRKDYTGNANVSTIITTFARKDSGGDRDYLLFRASSRNPGFTLLGNSVAEQMYVAEFELDSYKVSENDVISRGPQAFADAVNTINIGKFNLATAAVGLASRALIETYRHTCSRQIFGRKVSEFGQNSMAMERAAIRLVAMKAYTARCVDHMTSANSDDNRYVVLNSIAKVKVTEDATAVVHSLSDVISAKAFEADSVFRVIQKFVEYLPRLEGTKYVNLMQSIRAAKGFFNPSTPEFRSPRRTLHAGESPAYLLTRRTLGGIEGVSFAPWSEALGKIDHLPSAKSFGHLLEQLKPHFDVDIDQKDQRKVLALGELFAHAVYGSIIAEYAAIESDDEIWSAVFSILLEDFVAIIVRSTNELPDLQEIAETAMRSVYESRSDWPIERLQNYLEGSLKSCNLIS